VLCVFICKCGRVYVCLSYNRKEKERESSLAPLQSEEAPVAAASGRGKRQQHRRGMARWSAFSWHCSILASLWPDLFYGQNSLFERCWRILLLRVLLSSIWLSAFAGIFRQRRTRCVPVRLPQLRSYANCCLRRLRWRRKRTAACRDRTGGNIISLRV